MAPAARTAGKIPPALSLQLMQWWTMMKEVKDAVVVAVSM
jgi:hypothetical protein